MNPAVAHFYRKFRADMTRSADACLQSARSHVHFLHRLDRMVANGKKRSRAAKKGWKKRRAL